MRLFSKSEFSEFHDLKKANKAIQDADQSYSKSISQALGKPLDAWAKTLDPSLRQQMAEIFKCSQQIASTISTNSKSIDSVYANLQDLVGLRAEFNPIKIANQKIVKQAKDTAAKAAKAEKTLLDLQKSNANPQQIARAEAEHRTAQDAERSANNIAESSSAEFQKKFKDYQQRFVSILAASYCEASTIRANTASTLAEIGVQLENIAKEMKLEPTDTALDSGLLAEMQRLEPLFKADQSKEEE